MHSCNIFRKYPMAFQFQCRCLHISNIAPMRFSSDLKKYSAFTRKNILKDAERPHNHDLRCQAPQVMAAWPHLQHIRMCVAVCCFELDRNAHANMYMQKNCVGY